MSDPSWLRDRYFELRAKRSGVDSSVDPSVEQFLAEVESCKVEGAPIARVHGLALSYFPTARFKQLRFVDANLLDAAVRDRFARPCPDLPELAAAFVDPAELAYHCYENIIGLDAHFEGQPANPISVPWWSGQGHASKHVIRLHTRMAKSLRAALERLDALDLYVEPRGVGRGGQRFIFHAAPLADALTVALRSALPKSWLRGFVHVNPVFRCNRFEPGDARFESHVDVPFSWSARKIVSKRSLLLYLTGGSGSSVLRFADGLQVDEIAAGDLFVFDQRLEHEGGPFTAGPKLFLRTELLVRDANLTDAPDVAALFAKACYLEGESPFEPELARWANAQHQRAAKARVRGLLARVTGLEPFVHHEFAGVHFVTNGYDGYFRKADVGPIDAAVLLVLELLNPTIDGVPFRKLRAGETLMRSSTDLGWVARFLAEFPPPPEPPFCALDLAALFPAPESPVEGMYMPESLDFDDFPDGWDAHRNTKIVEALRRAQRWAKRRIVTAPIALLGKQVFVAPERFVVRGDKIHMLGPESLGPLHFAGAVWLEADDFLAPEVTIGALRAVIPPITFREEGELLHLCCDLFRNTWMVEGAVEEVPIPWIDEADVSGDHPWWRRAAARGSNEAELARELDEPLEPELDPERRR